MVGTNRKRRGSTGNRCCPARVTVLGIAVAIVLALPSCILLGLLETSSGDESDNPSEQVEDPVKEASSQVTIPTPFGPLKVAGWGGLVAGAAYLAFLIFRAMRGRGGGTAGAEADPGES